MTNPMKVMVVDDSLMVRMQATQALASAGFSVVEAQDGVEAMLKLYDHAEPALIVLDINMPNLTGIELLERMRDAGFTTMPVLILTTEGKPRLMEQAKALGAKAWILKPFRAETLVAAVRKLTAAA